MYVTIRRYKIAPGSTAELKRFQGGFLPIISALPGFIEYFWTTAGEDEVFSVSVFTDRKGAEESIRVAADYVRDHLTSMLPNPPDVIAGEVAVHQTKSQAEKAA
jgi:hypothetical protein